MFLWPTQAKAWARFFLALRAVVGARRFRRSPSPLARLLAFRQLVHQVQLDMLQFEESAPLVLAQLIDLRDESSNFEFGLQVHLVILFCPQPVAMLLPILTHHNYGRLNGSNTGKNQVQEDERKRIKWRPDLEIDHDPDREDRGEAQNEGPATPKIGHLVGQHLAKRPAAELFVKVAGQEVRFMKTPQDLFF